MIAICAYPPCSQPFDANATKVKQGQERYCSRECCWADYTPRPLAEKFWEKVNKTSSPDGCWLWMGRRDPKTGYGTVAERIPGTKKYRILLAHRVGYALQYGAIPEGLLVLHKPPCLNRHCIRHLYVGTHQDNANDARLLDRFSREPKNPATRARGDRNGARLHPERMPRGERHHATKLSDTDVQAIRASYTGKRGEQTCLAEEYGVSPRLISSIVRQATRRPFIPKAS